jgi:hypothetical protein
MGTRKLLDELDVADLESEAAHDYVLGSASAQDDIVEARGGRVDGGRARRTRESFRLDVVPEGLLVVRVSADAAADASVTVAGKPAGSVPIEPGRFQEVAVTLPHDGAAGRAEIVWRSNQPLTLLHYWSYGRVL